MSFVATIQSVNIIITAVSTLSFSLLFLQTRLSCLYIFWDQPKIVSSFDPIAIMAYAVFSTGKSSRNSICSLERSLVGILSWCVSGNNKKVVFKVQIVTDEKRKKTHHSCGKKSIWEFDRFFVSRSLRNWTVLLVLIKLAWFVPGKSCVQSWHNAVTQLVFVNT